jgi:hypothetical protein
MPPPRASLATSSPLSSAESAESFLTADASPRNPGDVTVTDISSPDNDEDEVDYRKARQLPPELKQHCQIYLEENLHLIALSLLSRLLSSGASPSSSISSNGAFCPPPNQLALLNTILVHPDFTTRPREESWPNASAQSLDYLRSLLSSVGPVNGRFKEAFRFGSGLRWSRGDSPQSDSGTDMLDDSSDEAQLHGRYAQQSISRRGQDFFSVVGWAFNCSVLYPNRWEHWRQWLDFMLDVLEADLCERARLDEEAHTRAADQNSQCEYPLLKDSMLAGYISQRSGRSSGGLKWIMKAIFADGSKSSASLFQELWHNEHRGGSKKAIHKRKREINIEKGEFGGLLDDDDSVYSSQASEPPTPQKRRKPTTKYEFQSLETAYVDSIPLRQRVFVLLSFLCHYLPDPPLDLPDLYETYELSVRSLPLSIFSAFISGTTSALRVDSQISTLQDMLSLFMPSSAVSPAKVNPERYGANGTSPAILERCFLPYAANTIAAEDNAKVSLLLEELVQLVWLNGTEPFTDKLHDVVMKGISARQAKVKKMPSKGRRNGGGEDSDAEAKAVLDHSSKRLQLLVAMLGAESDDEDGEVDMVQVAEEGEIDGESSSTETSG